MRKSLRTLFVVSGAAMLAGAVPAHAVSFILTDTGGAGAGSVALAGFQAAANFWAGALKDNVTIRLNIGFSALDPKIIGETNMNTSVAFTNDVYSALALDKSTTLDAAAVASLRPLSKITTGTYAGTKQLAMTVNQTLSASTAYSDKATRVDNDGSGNNVALALSTANLKALGFGVAPDAVDASIVFNNSFKFDFDPGNGIKKGQLDFVGVAIHEIGHALGFASGVDLYDGLTANSGKAGGLTKRGALDDYAVGTALDLFRYSAPGTLDWSTSANAKYFSVDGGATAFNGDAYFSLGAIHGDRSQASHWLKPTGTQCTMPLVGVMNPYACKSVMSIVTHDDLSAMDAIGWDLDAAVASNGSFTTAQAFGGLRPTAGSVPEPGTWLQMLLGFGVLGGFARLRRRRSDALPA